MVPHKGESIQMNTCTFVNFMQALKPWLKDDKILQASFDGNGKFTVVFVDGAKNLYHVNDCTSEQLEEAVELLRKHGVLFSE
jgi:hypothetical protein